MEVLFACILGISFILLFVLVLVSFMGLTEDAERVRTIYTNLFEWIGRIIMLPFRFPRGQRAPLSERAAKRWQASLDRMGIRSIEAVPMGWGKWALLVQEIVRLQETKVRQTRLLSSVHEIRQWLSEQEVPY